MKMTTETWELIKNFDPVKDNFGNPEQMESDLICKLQKFRERLNKPVIIHCGTNKNHSKTGEHPRGNAVDCHVKGVDLLDIFLAAEREGFTGIGLYDWGVHLDNRAALPARWGSLNGEHVGLTAINIDILRAAYQIHY